MSLINIFYQTSFLHNLKKTQIKNLIKLIFKNEGKTFKAVSIIFCNDRYLLKINQDFLKHNTYTDIITFNYSEEEIDGELYISFERAAENATLLNIDINNEIIRLIIHGILHLCGYTDKTKYQKLKMTKKENTYIGLFNF